MCVSWSGGGLLLLISQAKGHPKTEMQIKPIHSAKILQGRVAHPYGDASLLVYPTSNFFLIFFVLSVLGVFFLNFFSDFYFIC